MNDDLNKIEEQWLKRRLFSSAPRRRRWPWLLLLFVMFLLPVLFFTPLP